MVQKGYKQTAEHKKNSLISQLRYWERHPERINKIIRCGDCGCFLEKNDFSHKCKGVWNQGLTKETDERVKKNGLSTSKGLIGRELSEKNKINISKSLKKIYEEGIRKSWQKGLTKETDKRVKRISEKQKGRHHSPETEFKKGDINNQIKRAWKNLGKKPNKPETFLIKLINQNFPNTFRYTGNGKVWFEGFNPDFVCNPSKKIIEHFGDYWHNIPHYKKRDEERLKIYLKYGFKTLIIWEHELKNPLEVIEKIRRFSL